MTNDECLAMYNGLQLVKQPVLKDLAGIENKSDYLFHSKFVRAVSYNKRKLEPIIESLREAEKISDEYKEYVEKRDEILAEFAKKDADGNPEEKITMMGGQPRRSYNVPALHDKKSDVSKKIAKLEKDSKDAIDARKTVEQEMKDSLKEEVDVGTLMTVPQSMIPHGQDTEAMDGVLFMIEPEEAEPEEPAKKTKK